MLSNHHRSLVLIISRVTIPNLSPKLHTEFAKMVSLLNPKTIRKSSISRQCLVQRNKKSRPSNPRSSWEVLDITFLLVFQAKIVFFISSKIFETFRIISIYHTVWIDSKSNVNRIGPMAAIKAFFYGHSAKITLDNNIPTLVRCSFSRRHCPNVWNGWD